jgi:predicted amidohydrolase
LNGAISHKGESALPLERTFGCSEGNEVTVVDTARVRLGIAICYELEIPESSGALADRGAVNDEEVAVARLEQGGHCSRSIAARSNRAVSSRSGRPHGPADQPVSQTVG